MITPQPGGATCFLISEIGPPRPSISNECVFECTPNVKGLTCLPSHTEMPALGESD